MIDTEALLEQDVKHGIQRMHSMIDLINDILVVVEKANADCEICPVESRELFIEASNVIAKFFNPDEVDCIPYQPSHGDAIRAHTRIRREFFTLIDSSTVAAPTLQDWLESKSASFFNLSGELYRSICFEMACNPSDRRGP